MRFYETLYIVDANIENKSLEKEMDDVGKELAKTKSKIINHRVWGKKRLAYAIQRQKIRFIYHTAVCRRRLR